MEYGILTGPDRRSTVLRRLWAAGLLFHSLHSVAQNDKAVTHHALWNVPRHVFFFISCQESLKSWLWTLIYQSEEEVLQPMAFTFQLLTATWLYKDDDRQKINCSPAPTKHDGLHPCAKIDSHCMQQVCPFARLGPCITMAKMEVFNTLALIQHGGWGWVCRLAITHSMHRSDDDDDDTKSLSRSSKYHGSAICHNARHASWWGWSDFNHSHNLTHVTGLLICHSTWHASRWQWRLNHSHFHCHPTPGVRSPWPDRCARHAQ